MEIKQMPISRMSGLEKYPIHGDQLTRLEVQIIIRKFQGLITSLDCIEKAKIANKHINGKIILGALDVFNEARTESYGFDYKPPYMLHAWIEKGAFIFDLALPGVILSAKGLMDINREPCVLAGIPPDWIVYKPEVYFHKGEYIVPYQLRNVPNIIVYG